ncbi:MAG: glycosyltransferase [Rhodovibrio sp.]|nr:glycosyltransferase [Rhodovibrio sp.]
MTAPRVLSVIHAPHLGGPQRRNLALARQFEALGAAELTVALPDGPGAHALRAAGVDVRRLPLGRLRASPDPRVQLATLAGWPGDVARVTALIRETRADVVLLNGLANPQAALAARRTGAALVWQILDTRTPPAWVRLLRPWVRAWADCVMTTGDALAAAQLGVDPGDPADPLAGRVVSFAPPVDAERFKPDPAVRAAARAELGVGARSVVGMVANLHAAEGARCVPRCRRRAAPDPARRGLRLAGRAFRRAGGVCRALC